MEPFELGQQLLSVARHAVQTYLDGRRAPPTVHAGEMAAVFVTLREVDGTLRGCVGSLSPTQADIMLEAARSAVLAATRDPRFEPVRAEELCALRFEVSVLGTPEPVAGVADLRPERYGVVVRDLGGRRGLVLPGVPGVSRAEDQVAIACRKAGIEAGAPVSLQRFEVRKFSE
ncbi:MAG TPA: AmmeMemoRadiSam system protein A [Polyangiaceae bacterium]